MHVETAQPRIWTPKRPRIVRATDEETRQCSPLAGFSFGVGGRSGKVSGDWQATSIANCRAWYRASLGVTDAGGGACSAWADQSGAGDSNRNATQGTGANRPTITASDANFNSRQVLTFDGGDFLITGTFSSAYAQPITVYACFRQEATGFRFIYDGENSTNRIALLDDGGGPASPYLHAGGDLDGTSGAMPVSTTHVVCCVVDNTSSAIYVDRYSTADDSGTAGTSSLDGFTIGALNGGASNYHLGAIAEIIAYSGAHNSATRQTVMEALGAMYGVTISA